MTDPTTGRSAKVIELPTANVRQTQDDPPEHIETPAEMLIRAFSAKNKTAPDDEPAGVEPEPEEVPPSLWLPDSFWEKRPHLGELRTWCLSRGYAPDPTLVTALARYAAFLPKGTAMDTGLFSTQSSLNLTAGVIGYPGDAKSESMNGARIVVPRPDYAYEGGVGTGEGLADAFMGTVPEGTGEILKNGKERTQGTRKQVRWNAFLHLDEGNTLKKFDQRKGATILEAIRTSWTGLPLGATVASEDRKRNVEDYLLGTVIGWQPETAQWLLDDAINGTPQRVLYTRCNPKQRPPKGKAVAAPLWELPPDAMHLTFCDLARQEISDDYYAPAHSADLYAPRVMLMRAKVAALFACVEFSQLVTEEHWDLARQVVDVSTAIRKWLEREAGEAAQVDAEKRIADAAARAEAAATASRNAETNAQRDEATVIKFLAKKPGSTPRDVRAGAFKGPRRQLVQAVIDRLVASLRVRADDDGKLWIV